MLDLRCHLVCNICANGVCRQFSSSLVVLDSLLSFVAGLAPNCCNYTFYANRPRAVFSCFSSVFFPRIRAVCVSSALYIVPPKKTVVARGPYIYSISTWVRKWRRQHGSTNFKSSKTSPSAVFCVFSFVK